VGGMKPMINQKKLRKLRREIKKGTYRVWMQRCCVAVAVVCAFLLGSYYRQGDTAEADIEALRVMKTEADIQADAEEALTMANREVLPEYKDLFLMNPDLIGWLTIEGTAIDYPVMWTPENPEFYSQRGFDKQESKNGLLFLDAASNVNEHGGNLIVYGHNMKNGSMFADLLKYQKQTFWKKQPQIRLDTLYENRVYEIAAVARTNDLETLPYTFTKSEEESARSAIEDITAISLYDTDVDMQYGDDFLTLSTCDYSSENGRLVVMARRVK
ncbi:MAG: class B sortase, partial [Lachnospiraceae bacterium]